MASEGEKEEKPLQRYSTITCMVLRLEIALSNLPYLPIRYKKGRVHVTIRQTCHGWKASFI